MKITIKIHPYPDEHIKLPDYEIILEDDSTDNVVHAFKKLDYIFTGPVLEYSKVVK